MPTLVMMTVLVIGFLVSGIFSGEFQMRSDAILFSSKLGRSKAVIAKIAAGLISGSAVYWASVLIFSAAAPLLFSEQAEAAAPYRQASDTGEAFTM